MRPDAPVRDPGRDTGKTTATSLSGWGSQPIPAAAPKPSDLLAFVRVARRVHSPLLTVLLSCATACVVPPPLELDQPDAGANHPPILRRVRNSAGVELVRPSSGTIEFVVGEGELIVTTEDADTNDTLFVRMYFDYGFPADPTPVRVGCQAAPGAMPTVSREITCPLPGLCVDSSTLGDGMHILEIDVLDREPVSSVRRPFRDVLAPGEVATGAWNIKCVLPPT
jgi:hypothetical protein